MDETTETTGQAPDVTQTAGQAPTVSPATETDHNLDTLPKWAREKLQKANTEAADYRTKLRAREQAAADAARQRDEEQGNFKKLYETLQAEVATERHQALRNRIATEAGLPAELAARLTGDDEAALRSDAETLAKLIKPAGPVVPSTGATSPGRSTQPQTVEAQIESSWSQFYKGGRRSGIKF